MIIPIDNLEQGGINKDTSDRDLAPNILTDGRNVHFINGAIEAGGFYQAVQATPLVTPYGLFRWENVNSAGTEIYNLYFGDSEAYSVTGGASTKITPVDYTTLPIPTWSGGTFGGVFITDHDSLTDVPKWLNPATLMMEDLPNWPPELRCRSIRFFKQFVFAINLSDSLLTPNDKLPFSLRWSDITDPGSVPPSWDIVDPTTLAGERPFTDDDGQLIDAIALGDEFFVFSDSAMYAMRLSGNINSVFNSERRANRGLLAIGLAVEFERKLMFVSRDDIFITDGRQLQSVIFGTNRDTFFSEIEPTSYKAMRMVAKHDDHEVRIYYPTLGNTECNRIAVFDWTSGAWSFIDAPDVTSALYEPFDAAADRLTWDEYDAAHGETWDTVTDVFTDANLSAISFDLLVGTPTDFWVTDTGVADTLVGMSRFIERKQLTIQAPSVNLSTVKFVKNIFPKIDVQSHDGDFTIKFYFASQMNTGDPVVWQGGVTLMDQTLTTVKSKVDCRMNGRYLGWRMETEGKVAWRMTGLDIDIEQVSRW